MKCYNCKTDIPEGAAVCPECGAAQTVDQSLIDLAAAGDQNALSDLYQRTSDAVYSTVKFLVKDEDTALDILQDSYIKAFSSLDQLREAGSFGPWIKRIAHNKAIDYLRKSKDINFSSLTSEDSDEVVEFEDDRPDNLPETVIDRKETARLIAEILDSLPEDQRACISLYYYDQLSVKEIAEELQIPEATVKSRLQYGRKKIEAKVREMEKKGTRLYGIAPIPFLMLLFRQSAQEANAATARLLPEILKETSTLNSSASAKAAASTAAKSSAEGAATAAGKAAAAGVAKAGGSAFSMKIIAGVVAIALIAGGGAAISRSMRKAPEPPSAVEATMPEPPAPPEEPTEPAESEEEEEQSAPKAAVTYAEAFEEIRTGYEQCLAEGPGGDSPYLQYDTMRRVVENNGSSDEIAYAIYDINRDGTPEMVVGWLEWERDTGNIYAPFEIYAFDGNEAVPLTPGFVSKFDYINIYEDGSICTHRGNGGDPMEDQYILPAGGAAVEHAGVWNIYEEGHVSQDVKDIEYNSILTTIG